MAEQLAYGNTGLRYIQGNKNVLFSNGVQIGIEDFNAHHADKTLMQYVLSLQDSPTHGGYDYAYALDTGKLRKNIGVATEQEKTKRKQPQQKAAPEYSETGFMHVSSVVAQTILVLVLLGSMVMSAYHVLSFQINGGRPIGVAITTGITMVLFSAVAFTAGRSLWSDGVKGHKPLAGVLYFAGVIVVIYLMFATTQVNYEDFTADLQVDTATSVQASNTVTAQEELQVLIRDDIAAVEREIATLEATIATEDAEAELWRDRSWARHDTARRNADSARQQLAQKNAERSALTTELRSAIAEETQAVTEVQTAQESIYTFLAGIFGGDARAYQFIVYAIPSMFYDIMGPLGLTVVIILHERQRVKRKERSSK